MNYWSMLGNETSGVKQFIGVRVTINVKEKMNLASFPSISQ